MKSCIFTFRSQDWALATTVEIIMRHLSLGNKIAWGFWIDNLSFPRELPITEKLTSNYLKKNITKKKLPGHLNHAFSSGQLEMLELPHKNSSKRSTRATKVDEACYLELISRLRDSAPNIDSYGRLHTQLETSYLETYEAVFQILETEKPEVVYLYNGRFLQERAVVDCCAELGIRVIFFERFNPEWKTKYFLFDKGTHSPGYRSQIMEEFGKEMLLRDSSRFLAVGEKWFKDREHGLTQGFTKFQVQGPESIEVENFVVFFHSSEDELITTDLISASWGSQIEALEKLAHAITEIPNLNLIIRMHPNLKYKSSREIEQWTRFGEHFQQKYTQVTYLNHESKINSYELIKKSSGVITVGSTIGVEAAFMGKKSILIGRGFHEEMDITLNPRDKESLLDHLTVVLDANEIANRRIQAIKYAVFHQLGGQEFANIRFNQSQIEKYSWGDFEFSRPPYLRAISRVEFKCRNILEAVYEMFGGIRGL